MINLKSLKKFFPRRINYALVLVILISIPTFWNLIRPGYFKMHDDLQVVRVYEMSKCLQDGQLPCRWVPDMGYRYGYPQFNYYGPLPYYVMSFVNLLGVGLFDAVKIGFIIPLLLGNIFMFYFASSLFGVAGGFLATIMYAYSPYRGSDIYSRGAMGETWAFIFFPLILLYVKKIIDHPSKKNAGILALSLGALFATHNISTLIFTPMVGVWALLLLMGKYKTNLKKMLPSIGVLTTGVIISILVSAFFLLPVFFEKSIAHTETMIGGYFDYRAHFVTIKQLFLTSFWAYGSSEIGPADDLSFFFSPIMILMTLVSLFLSIRNIIKKKSGLLELSVLSFFAMGLLATFMTHQKSSFIWSLLPPLIYLQFPWRFLVTANFFFAVVSGYLLSKLDISKSKLFIGVIVVIVFLFSSPFFKVSEWYPYSEQEKLFGYLWDKQMTISIFDYLPIFAPMPPTAPAPVYPISSSKYSSLENFKKGTNWMSFNYDSKEVSTIKLNILEFPNWKITDNGKRVNHKVDNNGLVFIELDPGQHKIEARLTNSWSRTLGNLSTIIFLPITLFIILRPKNHVKE